jgi:hypothetical protein
MHSTTIRDRLRAPVYVARPAGGDPDVLRRPVGRWPALIDDHLWKKVQERLAAPLTGLASGRYLLTGFLRCPQCGGRSVGVRTRGRHQAYSPLPTRRRGGGEPACACSNFLAAPLDTAVLAEVTTLVQVAASGGGPVGPAFRTAWQEHRQHPVAPEAQRRLEELEREAEQARRRLAVGSQLLVQGDLDTTGYELVRVAAQTALEWVQREMIGVWITVSQRALPSLGRLRAAGRRWQAQLRRGRVPEQRAALRDLVDHVTAVRAGRGHYAVQITWTPIGQAVKTAYERAVQAPPTWSGLEEDAGSKSA